MRPDTLTPLLRVLLDRVEAQVRDLERNVRYGVGSGADVIDAMRAANDLRNIIHERDRERGGA